MGQVSSAIRGAVATHLAGRVREWLASQLTPRDALVVQFMAALVAQQSGQGDIAPELCDSDAGKRVLEHLRVLRERNRAAAAKMKARSNVIR